jgi:protein-L-isoaspartate(D-aspartate) O-methyltransferase
MIRGGSDVDRVEAFRHFFADLITANAGLRTQEGGLKAAFGSTPREHFVGPGPWRVFTPAGYISTPSDDPAFLYQDVTVALAADRQINNGQPVLHAFCLAALNPREGETAVHVGVGTGYYTAILAKLVGPTGTVSAYEIEQDLACKASTNLADMANVTIFDQSGVVGPLPDCDVLYVNAGATAPLDLWLDALRPGGRLLFPLTPADIAGRPAPGGMLLVSYMSDDLFAARFVCPAAFIPCVGGRDDEIAVRLSVAFSRGDSRNVQSLRRNSQTDETCWCAGKGWWLSTATAAEQ